MRSTTAAAAIVAVLTTGWASGDTGPGIGGRVQDPGQEIFRGKGACFACHGTDGKGTPAGPDLTDGTWINLETEPELDRVVELVREGVARPVEYAAPMPPMGGATLKDDELKAVAAYVLRLSKTPSSTH